MMSDMAGEGTSRSGTNPKSDIMLSIDIEADDQVCRLL